MRLNVNPKDIIMECSYLWDQAYKMAVHSVGVTDWSKATEEKRKEVDITQRTLFNAYVSRLNTQIMSRMERDKDAEI